MHLDPRDAALQTTCPAVPVPLFSHSEPHENGQRILVAANGLFLQFRNAWLDCIVRIAEIEPGLRLPYGPVAERLSFSFGVIPRALIEEFIARAVDALPNEIAGALVYDAQRGELLLRMHEAVTSGVGHVRYRISPMTEHEHLAVDLHSHGRMPAFWSATDDADDVGVRVCGVFGNLDRQNPSASFRLVINGMRRDLPCPWSSAAGVEGEETSHTL